MEGSMRSMRSKQAATASFLVARLARNQSSRRSSVALAAGILFAAKPMAISDSTSRRRVLRLVGKLCNAPEYTSSEQPWFFRERHTFADLDPAVRGQSDGRQPIVGDMNAEAVSCQRRAHFE